MPATVERGAALPLALGTAQLGLPYGVANRTGRPDAAAAAAIVAEAWRGGIRWFDTAQAYGDSEAALGAALRAQGLAGDARVITKPDPASGPDIARAGLRASLARLGVPALWGVLLHREGRLDEWAAGWAPLFRAARAEGWLAHAGASVYSPARALQALELDGLDALQVPASLFDRRAARAGVFARAAALGKTVFVRSVFLQGLALMEPSAVPPRMAAARRAVALLSDFCARRRLDRARFALAYARRLAPAGVLVLGAETAAQVRRNCALAAAPAVDEEHLREWDRLWPEDDEAFVDPSRWPK